MQIPELNVHTVGNRIHQALSIENPIKQPGDKCIDKRPKCMGPFEGDEPLFGYSTRTHSVHAHSDTITRTYNSGKSSTYTLRRWILRYHMVWKPHAVRRFCHRSNQLIRNCDAHTKTTLCSLFIIQSDADTDRILPYGVADGPADFTRRPLLNNTTE